MGQTPEIVGYYAANLNSGILTVRSANPNAFLFAFKNGLFRSVPSPSSRNNFIRQSIPSVTPGRDYISHLVIIGGGVEICTRVLSVYFLSVNKLANI